MAYKKVSVASGIAEPDIVAMQQEATNKRKMIEALRKQSGQRPTINAWGVAADIADALAEKKLASDAEEAQAGVSEKQKAMIDQAFGFADQQPQPLNIPNPGEYGSNIGNTKAIAAALKQDAPIQNKPAEPNWRLLAQLDPEHYAKMLIDKQNETYSNAVPTGEGRYIQTGNRGNVKFIDGASVPKEYQHVNQGNRIGAFDPSTGKISDLSNGGIAVSPNVSATLPIQQQNADTSRMNANLDSQKFAEEKAAAKVEAESGMGLFNTPEGFNAIVDKVIAGDVDVPKRPSKEWNNILAAASLKDPSFKPVDYATRRATKLSATSGKLADSFNALNTIAGHLGSLNMAVEELNNTRFPWLNKKLNEAGTALGTGTGDNVSKFKATVGPVAQELTRVYRGAGGSRADVEDFEKSMNENASFSQQKEAIKTFAHLVQSKLNAATNQFNQGMKTSKQGLELLTPEAQVTFKEILGDNSPVKGAGADKYNGFKILNVREK